MIISVDNDAMMYLGHISKDVYGSDVNIFHFFAN